MIYAIYVQVFLITGYGHVISQMNYLRPTSLHVVAQGGIQKRKEKNDVRHESKKVLSKSSIHHLHPQQQQSIQSDSAKRQLADLLITRVNCSNEVISTPTTKDIGRCRSLFFSILFFQHPLQKSRREREKRRKKKNKKILLPL